MLLDYLKKNEIECVYKGNAYPADQYTKCARQFFPYETSEMKEFFNRNKGRDFYHVCVQFMIEFPDYNSKGFELLRLYKEGDFQKCWVNWLAKSHLHAVSPFRETESPAYLAKGTHEIFKYVPRGTMDMFIYNLLFYTDGCMRLNYTGAFEQWLEAVTREGILRFDPYIYVEDGKRPVLAIKYNAILRFTKDCRFSLTQANANDIVYQTLPIDRIYSMFRYSTKMGMFVLYTAALSVCLQLSDFYSRVPEQMFLEYILTVVKSMDFVAIAEDLRLDAVHVVDSVAHVYGGYRICKDAKWDYCRYNQTHFGVQVEVPYCKTTVVYELNLSDIIDGTDWTVSQYDKTEVLEFIRRWCLSADNKYSFITGVLALFGIILDSKIALPTHSDAVMPSLDIREFTTLSYL